MLQPVAAPLRARACSVCLVDSGYDGLRPQGGSLAGVTQHLLESGNRVCVLYCGPGSKREVARHAHGSRTAGADFHCLETADQTDDFQVSNLHGRCHADRSDAVRLALQRMVEQQPIDHIVFAARDGLGFRAIQAKRARLAFEKTCLHVRLDTCSAWLRDQEHRWPCIQDLEIDFAERYFFENADGRIAANPEILSFVAGIGWNITNDVHLETDDDCWQDYSDGIALETTGEQARPLVTLAIPHYNLGRYLPDALASVAAQTYSNLEVLVIDDGSNDGDSPGVFDRMQSRYPRFRFLSQDNAGIGATRNRGLREARGVYFIPMDADNVARADMVERFVRAIQANPEVGAMTCYFLAFKEGESTRDRQYTYACRPTGGPLTLASLRNVYGDANAIFRTATFRDVGGYEIDRDTSFEDWEVFVKLAHAGHPVGVVPDHLFYYRHRETGFSRVTDGYRNHQRVLRQFLRQDCLPLAERAALWNLLVGSQLEADRYRSQWRHRMADRLHGLWKRSHIGPGLVNWFSRIGALSPLLRRTRGERGRG